MDKLMFYGHGGSKNHGCEAIVRSTKAILYQYEINTPVFLGTFRREEDYDLLNEKVVNYLVDHKQIKKFSYNHIKNAILNRLFKYQGNIKYVNSEIISNIDNNTFAFSIGGDNYYYGYPYNWIYINKASKNRQATTVLWGCSIEPEILLDSDIVQDMRRYDLITPRESITYDALISAGVTKNTYLFPDPAFILERVDLPLPEGFIEGNTIGINVSPLIQELEQDGGITYRNYSNLIDYIIKETNCNVALIPHVVWDHNNDLKPLTQLYNEFKHTGRVILITDHNCMELKGFIARCRMFIGARTHATIAAYSTCVPTLVVGYSVKAKGIAKDIFGYYDDYVIPVQSLKNGDDLVNAFLYIKDNEDEIRKHLQDFMPSYIEKAWRAGEEVKKLIIK